MRRDIACERRLRPDISTTRRTGGVGLKRVLSPVMDRDDVFVIADGAARRIGAEEAVDGLALSSSL